MVNKYWKVSTICFVVRVFVYLYIYFLYISFGYWQSDSLFIWLLFQMDSCDINCCCDAECSTKDRLTFSACVPRMQHDFDSHHCYKTQFIYRNNTEFKTVQNPDGLFCIVRDNLPSRFLFQNRKVSHIQRDKLWQVFYWFQEHEVLILLGGN